jgi:Temperature dependent protein affecting M2 dsRNA replication
VSDNGAGLAIAVSTYFDDVSRHGKKKDESTPSEDTKEEVKSNFGWLPQVPNITKNLKMAFNLWDAVSVWQFPMFSSCQVDQISGLCGVERSRAGGEGCERVWRGKCLAFSYALTANDICQ